MKDDQNLYRQQAELAKEREEVNALFELLTILKDAAMPQEEGKQND
jgi:hypothetical protein